MHVFHIFKPWNKSIYIQENLFQKINLNSNLYKFLNFAADLKLIQNLKRKTVANGPNPLRPIYTVLHGPALDGPNLHSSPAAQGRAQPTPRGPTCMAARGSYASQASRARPRDSISSRRRRW
jgi:hypothetical protein